MSQPKPRNSRAVDRDRRRFLQATAAGALWMAAGWKRRGPLGTPLTATGDAVPGLEIFDETMRSFMRPRAVPGGALAVVKDGRLVFARGYGLADVDRREPVQPDALFRIASISKPITSVAILNLSLRERDPLDLDAAAFRMLPLKPVLAQGASMDPRLWKVTIRQLLHHTGGFDRDQSFDPMFRPTEIARAVGVRPPAGPRAIIRYMMGRPLDFDPGTRYAYSNFGYCVLGRVIEVATGMPYAEYVRREILAPMGIRRMRLGRSRLQDRAPGEVRYFQPNLPMVPSIFPQDRGAQVSECYGGFNLEAMDSHGGWLSSAVSLVRFAGELDFPTTRALPIERLSKLEREPPAPPVAEDGGVCYGNGWMVRPVSNGGLGANLWHMGMLPGTNTILVRRWDGLAWAALFNQSATGNGLNNGEIDPMLEDAASAVKEWPPGDKFTES